MPSLTELKKAFSRKFTTLSNPQKEKRVYNPGEDEHPLTWNNIHTMIHNNDLDVLEPLQALYRARIIK